VSFVFACTQDPTHLDPALTGEFDAYTVYRNIYDPLVWTDEANSKLVPWLATSWDTSSDGMTHTFHLRQGVTFHDGSSLDAAAVKLSLDRYKATAGPGDGVLLDDIAAVTVLDTMTVQVATSKPDAWLPAHLAKFGILSSEAINANKTASDPWAQKYFDAHPVGCGAYKFVSWQPGVQIELAKNPQWWHGWEPGSIDQVIIKPVSESSTRVELVQSGQANFSTEWAIGDAVSVGKQSGFTLADYKTYNTDPIIFMNLQKPPFDKVEVRQAFQYAFDYDAMAQFFQGYSSGMGGPFPPFYPQANANLAPFQQDLTKAKALLAQAGIDPSTLDIKFMAPAGYPDLVSGATIAQASLQKIGVKVSVQQLPYGQITAAYTNVATAGMMIDEYNSPFTLDPTEFLSEFLPTDQTHDFHHYDSPTVVGLVSQIQGETDQSKQQLLLNQVQETLRNDAPCIWGGTPHTLIPVPDYVHGYVMQTTDRRFPCLFYLLRIGEH
jgi:peptide/nickel transport system substrate-binding protein